MGRLYPSWTQVECLVFLSICVAGIVSASWLWIAIGAMALLLIGWSRYRDLFARAEQVDAQWRDLATLAKMHNFRWGLPYYLRSRSLLAVLGAKLVHDGLFLTGMFLFGKLLAWLWGLQ